MDGSHLRGAAFMSVTLMLASVLISFVINKNGDVIYAYDAYGMSNIIIEDKDDINHNNNVLAGEDKDKLPGNNTYINVANNLDTTDKGTLPIINQLYEGDKPEDLSKEAEPLVEESVTTRLLKVMPDINMDIINSLGEKYLVIRKPQGSIQSYQLSDLYITKSLSIRISGLFASELDNIMVGRINNEKLFIGEPVYSEAISYEIDTTDNSVNTVTTRDYNDDPVHGISLVSKNDGLAKEQEINIILELDDVYVHEVYEDTGYYYIGLINPTERYDRILVIDAGHGGKDAGALSIDKKTYEKDINLKILLELKKLLDKEDIKVYYTRMADEQLYLRPRVELANAVDCDFFISIHCNAHKLTSPNGTEVYYYNNDNKGVKSRELASIISTELHKEIKLKQLGLVEKKDKEIFILRKAEVPAVLIETAFMTNNKDIQFLRKDNNIQSVAQGIYNGIMRAYDELLPE